MYNSDDPINSRVLTLCLFLFLSETHYSTLGLDNPKCLVIDTMCI